MMNCELRDEWLASSSWKTVLHDSWCDPRMQELCEFISQERCSHPVYPPVGQVFNAFRLTPLENVRVVILGQDPYHGPNQAHGLSFSVLPPNRPPPSLKNIFLELVNDQNCEAIVQGDLTSWATQGVFLLNRVLTVRQGIANSHRRHGWEWFTEKVISVLSKSTTPIVFVLWGNPAQELLGILEGSHHCLICSPHPSPLSAYRGFFGSRPFSKANDFLTKHGQKKINWASVCQSQCSD